MVLTAVLLPLRTISSNALLTNNHPLVSSFQPTPPLSKKDMLQVLESTTLDIPTAAQLTPLPNLSLLLEHKMRQLLALLSRLA